MDGYTSLSLISSIVILFLIGLHLFSIVLAFHEQSYLSYDEEDALLPDVDDSLLQEQNIKARDNWEYVRQNCYDKQGNELNKTIDGGLDWRGDPVTLLCSGLIANVKTDCESHLGFWKICEQFGIKMAYTRDGFEQLNPNLKTNYDAFKAVDELGEILDAIP